MNTIELIGLNLLAFLIPIAWIALLIYVWIAP